MPDLKPHVEECEEHLEDDIYWLDGIKHCLRCGKEIKTFEDEQKIKRTHDEGT